MLPLDIGVLASSAAGGDYWIVNKTAKFDPYFISATASEIFVKSGSSYEKYTDAGKTVSNQGYSTASGFYSAYYQKLGKDGYMYLGGYTYGQTSRIVKTNATTGAIVWQRVLSIPTSGTGPYGGYWTQPGGSYGGFQFSDIATDSSGNVYVMMTIGETNSSGLYTNAYSSGQFAYHGILVKLDSSGNTQWTRLISADNYGSGWSAYGTGILVDSSDSPIVTVRHDPSEWFGWNTGVLKFNSSGTLQWQKRIYGARSQGGYWISAKFSDTSNENILIGGAPLSSGSGLYPYVAKLDNSGNFTFQKLYGHVSGTTSTAYYVAMETQRISGNNYGFTMWGNPFGQSQYSGYYGEIDITSASSAATVEKQFEITAATYDVFLTNFKKYTDAVKNKTYLYLVGYTSPYGHIIKIATDDAFRSKTRTVSSNGVSFTISPNTTWIGMADSTVSSQVSNASGSLNVRTGPSIGNAADTTITSSGLVSQAVDTAIKVKRFS